jgi:hypothetical protein
VTKLKEKRDAVFDYNKLRRTVIKGIPCDFVPHRVGGGENCKPGEINIRAEVWKNVINLDSFKKKCVEKFNNENTEVQVKNAEELFSHFKDLGLQEPKSKFEKTLYEDVFLDLDRTDLGNKAYMIPPKTGKNPLFNVLMAYAHYDPEVSYCQGMNIITAWILKYTQSPIPQGNELNSYGLPTNLDYNELDSFFILLYICQEKKWREIYKPGMEKIVQHLTLLSEVLSTSFEQVYNHL